MVMKQKTVATGRIKNKPAVPAAKKTGALQKKFPIVGIGASAGGLEALEAFFSKMSADSGMAFVLVTHLDPDHASFMPELIQKKTAMKVQQVTDNMKIKPNRVYTIPPNREMAVMNGTLQLLEMSRARGHNLPIDSFFRSLAQDQTSNAIGIILSGTGTDGTLGIRVIKGETGLVMVQDPDSAKYDGMPRSAIETGLADFILEPSRMPEQLLGYANQTFTRPVSEIAAKDDKTMNALQKIYILLRSHKNHDFSQYKKNTICRRVERRMHIHQIDNITDYVRYLQESESEVSVLFKELLINVTNFFRDPEAFGLLKNKYLPALLQNKPEDYTIRVWVPGCSTGEEPYSVAIVLLECLAALHRHFNVQIFGTDIDEDAIDQARAGKYPESISVDVSPERLKKFFTREDNHYRINRAVRDLVVFAPQNIIKDPPFTKLDLLCCRNLLIYLGPELQQKLLPLFHYSLKQDGILFLGTSETIGQATDLFAIKEKKWKIFMRKPAKDAAQTRLAFTVQQPAAELFTQKPDRPYRGAGEADTTKLMQIILAQSDLPPCVIIDDRGEIIYIHGRTGLFLEPAEGEASSNILAMARPGLKAGLTHAIRTMTAERQEIRINGMKAKDNGGSVDINLIVRPLPAVQTGRRGLMMVLFDAVAHRPAKKTARTGPKKRAEKGVELHRLEDELRYTRENLQSTIEELETSNEELKSTNEELQSTNEELQSTNEELETSKEELHSLNEESATVNVELQRRIDDLSRTNDDIRNFLDATSIATIFLDADLCVRLFTPRATALIPLLATDVGRPLKHFANILVDIELEEFARSVLRDLAVQEAEVRDTAGNYYRMRVRPYRTANNFIDGVVFTFEDISELKQMDHARRLAAIVRDSHDAITLLDLRGKILAWNKGAEIIYGYTEAEALKMNVGDLVPRELKEETMAFIARAQREEMLSFVAKRVGKNGKIVHVWLTVSSLRDERGRQEFIATTEKDLRLLTKEARQHLTRGGDEKGP